MFALVALGLPIFGYFSKPAEMRAPISDEIRIAVKQPPFYKAYFLDCLGPGKVREDQKWPRSLYSGWPTNFMASSDDDAIRLAREARPDCYTVVVRVQRRKRSLTVSTSDTRRLVRVF